MRITIDASPLLLRSAGVKNYIYYWLANLVLNREGNSVSAFPFLDGAGTLNHEASVLGPLETIPRLALLYWVNLPGSWTLNWMNRKTDLFHATNQIRKAPTSAKLTATLFDMTCFLMPEFHTPGNIAAEKHFSEILKQASGLISISENTRQDAVRILGLDAARIKTIYPGIPEVFFEVTDAAAAAAESVTSKNVPGIPG